MRGLRNADKISAKKLERKRPHGRCTCGGRYENRSVGNRI
jgi:hypothetical protein